MNTTLTARNLTFFWSLHHGLYSYLNFGESVPFCLTYTAGQRYFSGPKTKFSVALNTTRVEDLLMFITETPTATRSVTSRFGAEAIYFPIREQNMKAGLVEFKVYEVTTVMKVCHHRACHDGWQCDTVFIHLSCTLAQLHQAVSQYIAVVAFVQDGETPE